MKFTFCSKNVLRREDDGENDISRARTCLTFDVLYLLIINVKILRAIVNVYSERLDKYCKMVYNVCMSSRR